VKGYKAFEKGLICREKQYFQHTVFEEEKAEICNSGMHFCENPLDTLDFYPLIDDNGDLTEFAEVEALDEVKTDDNKKFCTRKLKIGAKLDLNAFIKASVEFVFSKTNEKNTNASSGNGSQLANSGNNSQLANSGYGSQLASSGDYSKLASSGYGSQLASSGDYSKLASSGYGSQLASSGDYSKLASSGDYSKLANSGYGSQLANSGNNSQLANSGYGSKLASSGDYSQLASSGDYSKLASSGYGSQLASSGKNCVICCAGMGGKAKAKKGSWITLAEWKYDEIEKKFIPFCVKTVQVDGKKIKEDTYYKLENGEFVEEVMNDE